MLELQTFFANYSVQIDVAYQYWLDGNTFFHYICVIIQPMSHYFLLIKVNPFLLEREKQIY